MTKFSHIDKSGRARMVDVGDKPPRLRQAVASGMIYLQPETIELIRENQIKKGDVLTVAEVAGVQAAKSTPTLIPLCHPLNITRVVVATKLLPHDARPGVEVTATVRCQGPTGVEMEALTAVSVALLTIYDMCKSAGQQMEIGKIRLLEKTKE